MRIIGLFFLLFLFVGLSCTSTKVKADHGHIMEMNTFMASLWSLDPDSISAYVETKDMEMSTFSDKEKGFYFLLKTQYAKRMGNSLLQKKWAYKGIDYSKRVKDDTTLIPLYMVLSDFHFQRNQHDSAIYFGHKAIFLAESINFNLAGSAMIIANAYYGMTNYEKSQYYLKLGLTDKTDSLYKGAIYTNMAMNCMELGDSLGVRKYFSKAIEFHKKKRDYYNLIITFGNLAHNLYQKNEYQRGLKLMEEAIKLGEDFRIEIASNYDIYGDFLKQNHMLSEAEESYKKSIYLFKKESDPLGIIAPYKGLAELMRSQNRLVEAIEYMDTVNDFTFNNFQSELIDNVTEIELSVRDEQINTLKAQKLLEEEHGKLKTWILVVTVIGIFVLLILLYFYLSRRKFKERINKMTLEQRLMRTQMTPHFIFNAISSLQGLILTGNTEKANHFLDRFAQILRGSMENSTREWVSLQDELKIITNYVELQEMRYSSSFGFNISNIERSNELLIPPMIIQPFIENAIEHGLKPLENGGQLEVSLKIDEQEKSSILCIIKDNGVGIENAKKWKTKRSFSIELIRAQLNLLAKKTKSKAKLSVFSDENGTLVKIHIPFEESH